ncbi:hypothetical protein AVEN_209021-2-1, partial [Araneus ventricosus]
IVANNLREESRHHPLFLASQETYLLNSGKVKNNRETPTRTAHGPFRKAKDGDWPPEIYKGVEIRKRAENKVTRNEVVGFGRNLQVADFSK